jgi:hypothetical protein
MRRRPAGAVRPAIRSVVFGGNPRSDICSLRYLYLQAFYYRRERVFRRKTLRERACELAQKERERDSEKEGQKETTK